MLVNATPDLVSISWVVWTHIDCRAINPGCKWTISIVMEKPPFASLTVPLHQ